MQPSTIHCITSAINTAANYAIINCHQNSVLEAMYCYQPSVTRHMKVTYLVSRLYQHSVSVCTGDLKSFVILQVANTMVRKPGYEAKHASTSQTATQCIANPCWASRVLQEPQCSLPSVLQSQICTHKVRECQDYLHVTFDIGTSACIASQASSLAWNTGDYTWVLQSEERIKEASR